MNFKKWGYFPFSRNFGVRPSTSPLPTLIILQELRRQLVKEIHNKHNLEKDLAQLELKISLLIQNKTSINEIDRSASKKRKQAAQVRPAPPDPPLPPIYIII